MIIKKERAMNQYVKNSIDARRKVIDDYYSIPPGKEELVSSLFDEMSAMGETCRDAAEFEARFQDEFSERYNGLFTQLKIKASVTANAMKESFKQKGAKEIAKDAADTAAMELRSAARSAAREAVWQSDDDSPLRKAAHAENTVFQCLSSFRKKD